VSGRTHPGIGQSGAGADLRLLVLRGPTGTCGEFDCPHGALAVAADLLTALHFTATEPDVPGGPTAHVTRNRSWSASYSAGVFEAGEAFVSGSDQDEIGRPITEEDAWVSGAEGFDTSGPPLGLDSIEFEANVGETLRVTIDLDVSGSVEGSGAGDADFFDSLGSRVVDPLGRGLVFESSVPVPEPPRAALLLVAALALTLGRRRSEPSGFRPKRGAG
jgi:MYXO-CTERM domain-containing protein